MIITGTTETVLLRAKEDLGKNVDYPVHDVAQPDTAPIQLEQIARDSGPVTIVEQRRHSPETALRRNAFR